MKTIAAAPGKVILFGEHAVVYGQPAIAAPVTQVQACAVVEDSEQPGVRLVAPDLGLDAWLDELAQDDALAAAVRQVQSAAGVAELPALVITVTSTIPIASGLGSGAAIAAAVIRALARHLRRADLAENERVSALAYEVEKIHHGTPSGIDNTVVSYEMPVYFERRQPRNLIVPFSAARPLHLLIADTGVRSSTRLVVGHVREQWRRAPAHYERIFAACGDIALSARRSIERGDVPELGALMNENHIVLQEMGVSSDELDRLVIAARGAGALGAKLSGAGWGGNLIALIAGPDAADVSEALVQAGARQVIASELR